MADHCIYRLLCILIIINKYVFIFFLECPDNIPKMDCSGNPCDGAACPGYVDAECVPDYCGHCRAVWYLDDEIVQCSGTVISIPLIF